MGILNHLQMWVGRIEDRRRAPRAIEPAVIAHYWDGSVSPVHGLRDISPAGTYLYTAERWYIGTIIKLTLQTQDSATAGNSMTIPSRVVRHGQDGVGLKFIILTRQERKRLQEILNRANANKAVSKSASSQGQALVEFALILPLLFLLVVNAVNFGGFLFAWITVANASRAGAQYAIMGGASVGNPLPASAAQIQTLITNDISSLLNRSSLNVRVCTNNNATVTCSGTGSGATPADPEPGTYVLGSIDVTYTYQPFIPFWNFSSLGISATLPANLVLHRKAVMRMIQ